MQSHAYFRISGLMLLLAILLPRIARADQWQATIFEIGAQLGMAEQNAVNEGDPDAIVKQLQRAKQLAANAKFASLSDFDRLIERVQGKPTDLPIQEQIKKFREELTTKLSQHSPANPHPMFVPCGGESWVGRWDTNWGVMDLHRTEDGRIEGRYGPAQHFVEGKVNPRSPRVYEGIWRHNESDSTGRFRFQLIGGGEFRGAWTTGTNDPAASAVNWTGTRVEHSHPTEESSEAADSSNDQEANR